MLVSCLGDVMLDVLVNVPHGLVHDDDTPASITVGGGGQAANVAAWVSALGGRARLYGPRADTAVGRLVGETLADTGIEVYGPLTRRPGVVMSLVTPGLRSLASDPGSTDWLAQVSAGPWVEGADWLFISGYALLRSDHPERIIALAEAARAESTRVAVDLSSASMITEYGAARFRSLWELLRPSVIFANHREWKAANSGRSGSASSSFGSGGTSVLALKHGADGTTFVIDGIGDHRPVLAGAVRDVTGAGDALSAGYLVGGADLAMRTAARCVAQVGAQPESAARGGEGKP